MISDCHSVILGYPDLRTFVTTIQPPSVGISAVYCQADLRPNTIDLNGLSVKEGGISFTVQVPGDLRSVESNSLNTVIMDYSNVRTHPRHSRLHVIPDRYSDVTESLTGVEQ